MTELIRRDHIPAVWLNAKRGADCVYADDLAGAREGTERLLRLGHKRVAWLDLPGGGHASGAASTGEMVHGP